MFGFYPQNVPSITTQELFKKMLESTDFILIDVRTPTEFYRERLKGSVLATVDKIEERIVHLAPNKNKTIFLYCRTGGRSARATKILQELGYENVYNVIGGIKDWKEKGFQVVKG